MARLAVVLLTALLGLAGCGTAAPDPPAETLVTGNDLRDRPPPRPDNGAVVWHLWKVGTGQLVVDNATDTDAVATLVWEGYKFRSVYVRAGGHAEIDDVLEETYDVFVTQGTVWDGGLQRFVFPTAYLRLDERPTFTPDTRFTLTVLTGAGGSTPVPASAYPR